jgi:hypothetical protein
MYTLKTVRNLLNLLRFSYALALVIPSVIDGVEMVQLDFANIVYQYTRGFYRSDPEEALHYYFTYCLFTGVSKEYQSLCYERICEVVFHTKELDKLLGDTRKDGTKVVRVIPILHSHLLPVQRVAWFRAQVQSHHRN